MDGYSIISFGLLVLGGVLSLCAWLFKRDSKNASASEWKGAINTKLDILIEGQKNMSGFAERITKVEEKASSAHKRIDEHLAAHDGRV
jgi:hypothetical protein